MMRISELGDLTPEGAGPQLVLFGGAYSNVHALDALLARESGPMICTGDVVAYGADPMACIARIQARGIACIAGNVEAQLASGAPDCGCGFDAGSTCDLLSLRWYAHARGAVDASARAWMAALPDVLTFTFEGRRAAVIHGGATDVARFLWPETPDADLAAEIAVLSARTGPLDLVIAGHSGIPFQRRIGDVTWLNAGVIGLPPHDGTPATRFARLGQGGQITLHRLDYDHAAAAAAMRAAGLDQGYDTALETGWWPSEDILPPALRRTAPQRAGH